MELPVIMAAGQMPEVEFDRFPWIQPLHATLLKPFTVPELLGTVEEVLRAAANAPDRAQLFSFLDKKGNPVPPMGAMAGAPLLRPAGCVHHILAVDEDSDLRLLYADALARPGCHVDLAEDGAAAWEALQVNNYNLLITENDLTNLTGLELVRKLRAARMDLPVVMAAGRLPEFELVRDPSLQLAATLLKPFEVETLLDTVGDVLRATGNHRARIGPPGSWPSRPPSAGLQL